MPIEKRTRGRPRGTGKNDQQYLEKVADLMVSDSTLKRTRAMRRIIRGRKDWGASEETLLRRWQVKWNRQAESLLTAARERAGPKLVATPGSLPAWPVVDSLRHLTDSAGLRAAISYTESPAMKAMQDYVNSPAMRLMQEYINSPRMKLMQDYVNGPMMKAMSAVEHLFEQQRKITNAIDPPHLPAFRQIEEMHRRLYRFPF
jgi:hypothetical protein